MSRKLFEEAIAASEELEIASADRTSSYKAHQIADDRSMQAYARARSACSELLETVGEMDIYEFDGRQYVVKEGRLRLARNVRIDADPVK